MAKLRRSALSIVEKRWIYIYMDIIGYPFVHHFASIHFGVTQVVQLLAS